MIILIVFMVVGVFLVVSSTSGTGNRRITNRRRNHYNGDLNNFNYIDSNIDYNSSHHHHDSGSDFGGDSGCDGGSDCGGGCDGGGSCD